MLKNSNMAPKLSHHSVFYIWFSFLCVLFCHGIARQWSCTAILSLKLWSHARILVSRTWGLIITKIILSELTLGCTRGKGGGGHPHKVFLSFFVEDKTSAPDVFSSCLFILHANFETSLVMVSCYGYDIWRHKYQVVKPFLGENTCFFIFFQQ